MVIFLDSKKNFSNVALHCAPVWIVFWDCCINSIIDCIVHSMFDNYGGISASDFLTELVRGVNQRVNHLEQCLKGEAVEGSYIMVYRDMIYHDSIIFVEAAELT